MDVHGVENPSLESTRITAHGHNSYNSYLSFSYSKIFGGLKIGGLGHSATKVAHNHLGFVHDAVHLIAPPLQHLLALLCVLGNDVHSPNPPGLMAHVLSSA
jgi:hypothetical protein